MVAVDMRRKLVRMSDMSHFYTRGDGTYMREDCGSFAANGMRGSANDLILSAPVSLAVGDSPRARQVVFSDDMGAWFTRERSSPHWLAIKSDRSLPDGTIELRSAYSTLAILSGWTP